MNVTKKQAAEANLDAAIDAFLRGDWVPSIHLAGAAEEVFGWPEEAKGGKTIPDSFWQNNQRQTTIVCDTSPLKPHNGLRILNFSFVLANADH